MVTHMTWSPSPLRVIVDDEKAHGGRDAFRVVELGVGEPHLGPTGKPYRVQARDIQSGMITIAMRSEQDKTSCAWLTYSLVDGDPHLSSGELTLDSAWVEPDYRGEGMFRALFTHMAQAAPGRKVSALCLSDRMGDFIDSYNDHLAATSQ